MAVTAAAIAGLFPGTVLTDRLRMVRVDVDDGADADGVDGGDVAHADGVDGDDDVADVLDLYEYWRTDAPNVDVTTEYVSWEPYDHPHGVAETLERAADRVEDGDGAMYLLRPREGEPGAGELAGTAGLFADWDRRLGRFGMWLRKPFWGRGYSGERADAMFELAFDRLDLDLVRVSHVPANENSERAITKYVDRHGGRRAGRCRNRIAFDDGSVHDTVAYSVSQGEWREADGARTAVAFRD